MATSKKGKSEFKGKIGNTVTYELNGQTVKRTIGKNTKDPTKLQLAVRSAVALVADLLRPVKGFIRTGFALEVKNTLLNANNKATSINILNAVKGVYPNQYIDYSKAIFSGGKMPVNTEIDVSVTDTGLAFAWDPAYLLKGMHPNDRVLLIAYCPEKKYAFYETDGARRKEGKEQLPLMKYHEKVTVHTYLAFIAANKKSISTTIYTGEFLW